MRLSFTCILNFVLYFTCVYIGLTLLVLIMSERDHNDHSQKDQCKINPDLQFDQWKNTQENTPNSEFENLRI